MGVSKEEANDWAEHLALRQQRNHVLYEYAYGAVAVLDHALHENREGVRGKMDSVDAAALAA